jgi:hypothetical protein
VPGGGGVAHRTISANSANSSKTFRGNKSRLDTSIQHGLGRTAKRVLKATEIAEGISFPRAVQVLQLTRILGGRIGKMQPQTGRQNQETSTCDDRRSRAISYTDST